MNGVFEDLQAEVFDINLKPSAPKYMNKVEPYPIFWKDRVLTERPCIINHPKAQRHQFSLSWRMRFLDKFQDENIQQFSDSPMASSLCAAIEMFSFGTIINSLVLSNATDVKPELGLVVCGLGLVGMRFTDLLLTVLATTHDQFKNFTLTRINPFIMVLRNQPYVGFAYEF